MKFIISKRARSQIDRIQAWWAKNRPAAPALFLDELAEAERNLRTSPESGTVFAVQKAGVARRVVLPETRHHLFFRYRRDRNELLVLAVWGAPREHGPKS